MPKHGEKCAICSNEEKNTFVHHFLAQRQKKSSAIFLEPPRRGVEVRTPPPQPWGSGSPHQPQNQSKQWPSNALNPAQRGCPARGGQQEAGPQLALLRRFIRGGGGARWTPGIGPHTDDGGCPFHGRLGRSLADDLRDLRPGEAAMRAPMT